MRLTRFLTWLVSWVVAVGGLVSAVWETAAQPRSPYTRYQHAAWYIYHIAQYTEWPKETFPDETAPFVLGILGEDPFHENIDVIKNKTIKNRKLVIRYCKTVEDATSCQTLFICESEKDRLPQILKALDNFSILTFSECEGFIPQGGMVKFWIEKTTSTEGFLFFQINQAATE